MTRIKRTTEPGIPAPGFNHRNGRRLVLDIDSDTFSEIQQYAVKEKITVSAAVRELVEFGLEAVEK